jgi:hypothetical protein
MTVRMLELGGIVGLNQEEGIEERHLYLLRLWRLTSEHDGSGRIVGMVQEEGRAKMMKVRIA